jgi:hypothetical protein
VKAAHGGIDFKKGPNRSARRKGTDGKVQHKTQPEADPDRIEETTWLTKDQLHDEALKPSTKWIQAGHGDVGRVFVEIIGCDNLVNLDLGVNDHTDPFAAIVFEDSLVRTDVIYDCLQPRWMPWSSRAFAFNIVHPSSLLFFGVFDYDELGAHDPIGRLAINTSKFQSNTTYLLHYRLRNTEIDEDVSIDNHEQPNLEQNKYSDLFTRTAEQSPFVFESNGRMKVTLLGKLSRQPQGSLSTFRRRSL